MIFQNIVYKKYASFVLDIVFFIVLITTAYARYIEDITLEQITKPMIVGVVLFMYLSLNKSKINYTYILGLIVAIAGDVIIDYNYNLGVMFSAGFYILYALVLKSFIRKINLLQFILFGFPFILTLFLIILALSQNIDLDFILILIYGFAVFIYGASAFVNYLENNLKCHLLFLIAAFTFTLSDSIMAIHTYYDPKTIYSILIIVFYGISHYIVGKAIISKSNKLQSKINLYFRRSKKIQ